MESDAPVTRTSAGTEKTALFGSKPPEPADRPFAAWAVAAVVILAVAGGLALAGRNKPAAAPNTLQPLDPYAASLSLSGLAMSESSSLSAVKLTYLDGRIQNNGAKTLSAATVQVVFQNDEALPPRVETQPLALIRTRQPYIDTEPLSAEPIKPGEDREFRLIFESVPSNWNTQLPEVRIIHTTLR